MATPDKLQTNRLKAAKYRERQRALGLRPVQFWLPDIKSEAFLEEAARQAKLASQVSNAEDDQAWVDSVSWFNDPQNEAR